MSGRTTRVAPALLATLVACVAMTPAALRAEPAAAQGSSDDCLAKPNGAAPAGSHWFYRVERASGRRCWHLRAQAGQADSADAKADQGEPAATPAVPAPAGRPTATSPEPQANSGDEAQSAAAPVAPPPAAPADWPSAPAPSQTATPITDTAAPIINRNDSSAEPAPATRAIDPQFDARAVDANAASAAPTAAPAPPMAPPTPAAAPPSTSAIDPAHIPALLGTALVLLFIILGSIGAQFAGRVLQRRRHRRALHEAFPSIGDPPASESEAMDLYAEPAAPSRVRRKEREPHRQVAPRETPPLAAASDETAQVLEENVRELLHRLRSDLKPKSPPKSPLKSQPASAPSGLRLVPPAVPPVPGDLEAALAVWAGNKKRVPQ